MFIEILPRFWITSLNNTEQKKYVEFYKITNIIDCYQDIKQNNDTNNYFIELVKIIQNKISKLESILLISKNKQHLYTVVLLYNMIFGKISLEKIYTILKNRINDFEINENKNLLNLVNKKI